MAEPYPGKSRIVNMIKSCCVHNGGRTWCDFSGPLVGGVPFGEGSESKVGGTTGFFCIVCIIITPVITPDSDSRRQARGLQDSNSI